MVLENWLKAARVTNFEKLKDLIVKDRMLSAVPSKMANFLMEQRAGDFEHLEREKHNLL